MEALVFREEEKPKFGFRTAFGLSLLLLLLLIFIIRETRPFSLSQEEMALLAEREQELERELTFRFLEEPSNVEENEDPEFLSDADRVKASQQQAEVEPENNDPISRGDTYELENAPVPAPITQPTPPTPAINQPDQQAQQQVAEASQSEAQEDPNEVQEEPQEVEPAEVEAPKPTTFDRSQGNIPVDPGAPKPFRRLSKADREVAKERAAAELQRLQAPQRQATPPGGGRRFDNPAGSPSERLGFSIDTGEHQLGPYLEVLRQLVKANWRVPAIARYEVSGIAVVSFTLHKDGLISDAIITRSAEIEPLDTSSLNAIINVYKAPPLPQHITEDNIPIRFAFYYNVRPRY